MILISNDIIQTSVELKIIMTNQFSFTHKIQIGVIINMEAF